MMGPHRALGIAALLALLLLPAPASAERGVPNYPRVAQVASAMGDYSEAQIDSLAWYDIVAFSASPYMVDKVRDRNPEIELLFVWLPQSILAVHEDETFWYPDTTWSLPRLAQYYAIQNDWFLYDTSGNRIEEWGIWTANWTRYCPKGTVGSSIGKTYSEWLIEDAIPRFVNGEADWEAWGPGSSSYQGFFFEIFADCVGSFGYSRYINADPDRDGLPEGVSHGCASGGAQDSLSILYREENEAFGPKLVDLIDDDLIVIMNSGNKYIAPSWHEKMTGQKLESWLQSPPHPSWHTWWKYFYELTDYGGADALELGYMWAENNMGNTGQDNLDGWDHSMIQVVIRGNYSSSDTERWKRFGLGTSMLGDGFFSITEAQKWPHWQPEFDWDFGAPLDDFSIQTYSGGDSIYVRRFDKGMVEVNPNASTVKTIPPKDSRFTFWQPVTDLVARSVGGRTVRLDFTSSDEQQGPIDAYRVRYAPWPITLANWNSATEALAPIVSDPSHAVSVLATGLPANSTLYFAVRNEVHTDLEIAISNVVNATTGSSQTDTTPPAAITDISALSIGDSEVTIEWTAPGDDGTTGRAALYEIRTRRGPAITTQAAWLESEKIVDMTPLPKVGGQTETFTVTGLVSGTLHALAIRTYDEAGNLSGLSNPFTIVTSGVPPPSLDDDPPGKVNDLQVALIDSTAVELTWTAPGDDNYVGQATAYEVRALQGHAIVSKTDWNSAEWPTNAIPAPKTAGSAERFRFEGLSPATLYGFAVRAIDDRGLIGSTSNSPTATTLESQDGPPDPPDPPDPPPDPVPPTRIVNLGFTNLDSTSLVLRWTAPNDGEGDPVVAYKIAMLTGETLVTNADWDRAQHFAGPPHPKAPGGIELFGVGELEPSTLHSFAIRSIDGDSLWSATSNVLNVTTLEPPPPPPPPPPPDVNPPSAITDLSISFYDSTRVRLSWRAPDDGEGGAVSSYTIGVLAGDSLLTLDDWDRASHLAGPATPALPGVRESYLETGLDASTLYGFAVRSTDGEDRLSELGNSVHVVTLDPVPGDDDPPDPPDPPEDTTPPRRITDLAATNITETSARLTWTAPGDDGDKGRASQYRLFRNRAGVVDSTVLSFIPKVAGGAESHSVSDLEPGRTYQFWIVSIDDAELRSEASNQAVVSTPETPPPPPPPTGDTTPPAAVDEVALVAESATRLRVTWTAVGDDGDEGDPALYRIGFKVNGAIATESDWSSADTSTVCPPPSPVGEEMELVFTDLLPETAYGFAVRAVDEEGLRSALSSELAEITMPVAPDTLPPDAVFDLKYERIDTKWVDLVWTAPSDPPKGDRTVRYHLVYSTDGPIEDEEDWSLATRVTDGLSDPAAPGEPEFVHVDSLLPETAYAFAIRAEDAAGNLANLSGSIIVTTLAEPDEEDPAQDTESPAAIADLSAADRGTTWVDLVWTAPSDPPNGDSASVYQVAFRSDGPLADEDDWLSATLVASGVPTPAAPGAPEQFRVLTLLAETEYAFAVRSVDAAGNVSALSTPFSIATLAEPDDDPEDDMTGPAAISDLVVAETGTTWVDLVWTAPSDPPNGDAAYRYLIAYSGDGPLEDEAGWSLATRVTNGVPDPAAPGESESLRVSGLSPDTEYAFAIRAEDVAGNLAELSAPLRATTLAEPDDDPGDDDPVDTAPSPILDLTIASRGPTWVQLEWTATGENADSGSAASYLMRYLRDDPILNEEDWAGAHPIEAGLPEPGVAGQHEQFRLEGLNPNFTYTVCVRAVDGAGQLSPFVPSVTIRRYDAPPPVLPLPVGALSLDFVEARRAQLRLQHPEIPQGGSALSFYVIGIARTPITDANWNSVGKFGSAPEPGVPGTEATWMLTPLLPGTQYYVAVRSRDVAGNWSLLSPVLDLLTPGEDLAPPDVPRGLEVTWMEDGRLHVSWSPSTDLRVVGYHVYAEGVSAGWTRLTSEPVTETSFESERPNPQSAQRVAVTSVLANGSESSLSGPLSLFATAWELDGPFPHPVRESGRFELSIPWEAGGSMRVSVYVLDVSGTRVRELGEREVFAGQVTEWTWDRADERGRRVAPGYYYVRVTGGGQELVRTVYVAP